MSNENLFINRLKAFGFALKGLFRFVRTEKSAWIHSIAAIVVVCLSFYFQLTKMEWVAILFAIGFVITTEILNTSIEELVDLVQPDFHPKAGNVKDFGAAAVFISVIISLIIFSIIFIPKFQYFFS